MKTDSIFIEYNLTKRKFLDIKGEPLEGVRIGKDKKTIYRFRNGYLDGDVYDIDGRYITTKPAVEAVGHIEYWRCNKLHRDNNEPAVISQRFTRREYWNNGIQVKIE